MFPSQARLGGLLWKRNRVMSEAQKANARKRLKDVDAVIEAVRLSGVSCKALDVALRLPKENEMPAKDKYTIFSRKHAYYRKPMHFVPKFTKITHRVNPLGF